MKKNAIYIFTCIILLFSVWELTACNTPTFDNSVPATSSIVNAEIIPDCISECASPKCYVAAIDSHARSKTWFDTMIKKHRADEYYAPTPKEIIIHALAKSTCNDIFCVYRGIGDEDTFYFFGYVPQSTKGLPVLYDKPLLDALIAKGIDTFNFYTVQYRNNGGTREDVIFTTIKGKDTGYYDLSVPPPVDLDISNLKFPDKVAIARIK